MGGTGEQGTWTGGSGDGSEAWGSWGAGTGVWGAGGCPGAGSRRFRQDPRGVREQGCPNRFPPAHPWGATVRGAGGPAGAARRCAEVKARGSSGRSRDWPRACPIPRASLRRRALSGDVRAWLSAVTQIELEPTIDISCAKYECTGQSARSPVPDTAVGVQGAVFLQKTLQTPLLAPSNARKVQETGKSHDQGEETRVRSRLWKSYRCSHLT